LSYLLSLVGKTPIERIMVVVGQRYAILIVRSFRLRLACQIDFINLKGNPLGHFRHKRPFVIILTGSEQRRQEKDVYKQAKERKSGSYRCNTSTGKQVNPIGTTTLPFPFGSFTGQPLPEEQLDNVNLMAAIILLCLGLITIAVSIPLYLGKIKMNYFYGFRIPKAFESEENWYAINHYGAKALIRWSLVIMAIGIGCLYIEPQHVLAAAKIAFISLLVPIVQTCWYARSL